jgi:hypothetical protein
VGHHIFALAIHPSFLQVQGLSSILTRSASLQNILQAWLKRIPQTYELASHVPAQSGEYEANNIICKRIVEDRVTTHALDNIPTPLNQNTWIYNGIGALFPSYAASKFDFKISNGSPSSSLPSPPRPGSANKRRKSKEII